MSIQSLTRRLAGGALPILGVAGFLAAAPASLAAGTTAAAAPSHETVAPVAANGVVIIWNRASQRYEVPADQQAADLARELQDVLAGSDSAQRAGLAEKTQVEVLPNGLARARTPVGFLSLSVLRPAGEGFAPVCAQGPQGALRALATPAAGTPAER